MEIGGCFIEQRQRQAADETLGFWHITQSCSAIQMVAQEL
jgi:hypothetical protein